MSVVVENAYPSTHDCAETLKQAEDAVLTCLINARERYGQGPSRSTYICDFPDGTYEVCAVGAVAAVDGITEQDIDEYEDANERIWVQIEQGLSTEAKTAIELLNAAVVRLYPAIAHEVGDWSGPLEALNQDAEDDGFVAAVLECYDEAIFERRQMAV